MDLQAMYEALDSQRRELSLSWAGLTREVNAQFADVPCHPIATSTITGLKSKPEVIGNAALQLLVWLERTPESFIRGRRTPESPTEVLAKLEPNRILRFDTPAVYRAMDSLRRERGLSWKQVASEIGGVTGPQLTRFRNGGGIGIVTATRIARWLDRPVASFTVASTR